MRGATCQRSRGCLADCSFRFFLCVSAVKLLVAGLHCENTIFQAQWCIPEASGTPMKIPVPFTIHNGGAFYEACSCQALFCLWQMPSGVLGAEPLTVTERLLPLPTHIHRTTSAEPSLTLSIDRSPSSVWCARFSVRNSHASNDLLSVPMK